MKKKIYCVWKFLLDATWYVPRFALLMGLRMWQNRHKYVWCTSGHWKNDSAWSWLARTQDEVTELKKAMKEEADYHICDSKRELREKRKLEAADVANFAMMAAYTDEID